jgi:hypothetical protein
MYSDTNLLMVCRGHTASVIRAEDSSTEAKFRRAQLEKLLASDEGDHYVLCYFRPHLSLSPTNSEKCADLAGIMLPNSYIENGVCMWMCSTGSVSVAARMGSKGGHSYVDG